MDDYLLLVGLGNPGTLYRNNRHNVGFRIIDSIAEKFASYNFKKMAYIADVAIFSMDEKKIILSKPQTFMNLSGKAAGFLIDFYKIPIQNVYVFHDDIDLEFGHVKIKQGGGNGGHNGLKSIGNTIGNDYWRLRIGIGRPTEKYAISSYVLSDFEQEEEIVLKKIFYEISKNFLLLFSDYKKLETLLNSIK
ncbi:MAG: aminoacyl-tRNA hydrolase [Holosporaceae bacterium]|jgi:PTH1 family peptidyl-tRNA hydrolase|nr:aminoacyl-tRNA hydrolase [Holosporaceae bacterium]